MVTAPSVENQNIFESKLCVWYFYSTARNRCGRKIYHKGNHLLQVSALFPVCFASEILQRSVKSAVC
jgi:hypothetical protein